MTSPAINKLRIRVEEITSPPLSTSGTTWVGKTAAKSFDLPAALFPNVKFSPTTTSLAANLSTKIFSINSAGVKLAKSRSNFITATASAPAACKS